MYYDLVNYDSTDYLQWVLYVSPNVEWCDLLTSREVRRTFVWWEEDSRLRHECTGESTGELLRGGYGSSITYCTEDNKGRLWAGNGEYESVVNFCPYCGMEAESKRLDQVWPPLVTLYPQPLNQRPSERREGLPSNQQLHKL